MLSRSETGRIPPRAKPAGASTAASKAGAKAPAASKAPAARSATKLGALHDAKVVDPLGNERHKTPFASIYAKGGIPCRLQHGSVRHKLVWTTPGAPASLDYDPVFVTFCQGLRETQHPFVFVVHEGLREMMDAPGARDKVVQLLPQIVAPLRGGLSQKDKTAFLASLQILSGLARLVGPHLVAHLGTILPPVATRVLAHDQETRERVQEVLAECQVSCGEGALKIIRSRVPTFAPLLGAK
ncbi:hypothetical protein HK105_208281 [Polyrhizophydium stewartii]|uniref:Uncharacterized protein n=1 Tax=Polyrhizophydium stewartii TaxID=2732419 RepID=A0ABR4MYB0_9FUNG